MITQNTLLRLRNREYALGGVGRVHRRPVLRRTGTKRITDKLNI